MLRETLSGEIQTLQITNKIHQNNVKEHFMQKFYMPADPCTDFAQFVRNYPISVISFVLSQ